MNRDECDALRYAVERIRNELSDVIFGIKRKMEDLDRVDSMLDDIDSEILNLRED